jgi:hypothetical protein
MKKNYMSLLKEAISEFDTSDNVDVKGPMLDPILSWDGDGELPTYKDAASILERYYFNEDSDNQVDALDEADYENDKGSSAGKSMDHTKGAGTEQAGTSDAKTVPASKDEKEKDITKEAEEVEKDEEEDEEEISEDLDLEMENTIIEKLIAEMEDEDDDDDDKEGMEEAEVMTYKGKGPKEEMPNEKKTKNPEQDAQGAGTQQAGTGNDDVQVPDRKDNHNDAVKPKKYTDENTQIEEALAALEAELLDEADDKEDDDDEEEKDLDVDKEVSEAESSVPGGPSPKKRGEDYEEDEAAYAEAFSIFKEAIKKDSE